MRDWRKAAWQRDDFFAQIKLGQLYAHDASFYDPVEAFVWYSMALRDDRNVSVDEVAADTFNSLWNQASDDQSKLSASLTLDQRLEARQRIIYVLGCRGADGFISLGRLHESANSRYGPRQDGGKCRSSNSGSSSSRMPDARCQPESDDSQQLGLVPSDSDALMYFDIAQAEGHPLANDYARSPYNTVVSNEPGGRDIVNDARSRSLNWFRPFEFYPGQTRGGTLHTDECVETLEQHEVLKRANEIWDSALERALWLMGLLKSPNGAPCPPALLHEAIGKFQNLLSDDPTGFLTAQEKVRLIQMAAVNGDADSQVELGVMYTKGIGVVLNYARAEYWFSKAADQRCGEALYYLGVLYQAGVPGVQRDTDKAARYVTASALAGFKPIRNRLVELLAKDCKSAPECDNDPTFASLPPKQGRGTRVDARSAFPYQSRNQSLNAPVPRAPSVPAAAAIPATSPASGGP